MGDKAALLPLRDSKHFVLNYDRSSKSLLLIGPASERYVYGPIEPEDAKALYRYAASGHNALSRSGGRANMIRLTNDTLANLSQFCSTPIWSIRRSG